MSGPGCCRPRLSYGPTRMHSFHSNLCSVAPGIEILPRTTSPAQQRATQSGHPVGSGERIAVDEWRGCDDLNCSHPGCGYVWDHVDEETS